MLVLSESLMIRSRRNIKKLNSDLLFPSKNGRSKRSRSKCLAVWYKRLGNYQLWTHQNSRSVRPQTGLWKGTRKISKKGQPKRRMSLDSLFQDCAENGRSSNCLLLVYLSSSICGLGIAFKHSLQMCIHRGTLREWKRDQQIASLHHCCSQLIWEQIIEIQGFLWAEHKRGRESGKENIFLTDRRRLDRVTIEPGKTYCLLAFLREKWACRSMISWQQA